MSNAEILRAYTKDLEKLAQRGCEHEVTQPIASILYAVLGATKAGLPMLLALMHIVCAFAERAREELKGISN